MSAGEQISITTPDDAQWMHHALQLAERGRGSVEPNPMVGAVIVKDGRILGEGYHEKFGGPHAEIHALRMAGAQATGATAYVTLEPCCHTGKTGPCTRALIEAKVSRVVAAVLDPNPLVAGRGVLELRHNGIAVVLGTGARRATRINAPFFKLINIKRPYVIAKWAQTLDGALADRFNSSKWISCEESRQQVHTLRGRVDAILVGIGTVLADDPLLTARPRDSSEIRRRAIRCVLDAACRLPLDSRLVQSAREYPTVIFHHRSLEPAAEDRRRQIAAAGVECVAIEDSAGAAGELNFAAVLDELGRRMISNLLVEGGGEVLGHLLRHRLVDEAHVFIAPRILGDDQPRRIILQPSVKLNDALNASIIEHSSCGTDIKIVLQF
ncbi:MAG: bifunctional diaminohydroxyphosphoribosylaminopyrimidine deaminase/5-amino-6-(5-phosphoribosylamino)uracil reductase RibD [Phycisphaerae bacterium]